MSGAWGVPRTARRRASRLWRIWILELLVAVVGESGSDGDGDMGEEEGEGEMPVHSVWELPSWSSETGWGFESCRWPPVSCAMLVRAWGYLV